MAAEYTIQFARLSAMSDGWLDGEGFAPTKQARVAASNLLHAMEAAGLPRASVYPTIAGGVRAEWTVGKVEAAMECGPDGSWSFDFLDRRTMNYVSIPIGGTDE